MNILIDLYLTFLKLGLFTFGGGYAMLPLLEREVVENKKWATKEEILDYYAIGQATPGIIAVNTSTFCGYSLKGRVGAIVASLGFITPSIIIITIIANFLQEFSHVVWIQHALSGIRVAVCALVLNAVIKMAKDKVDTKIKLLIFLATFAAIAFLSMSPVIVVIIVAVIGILMGRK